MDNSDLKCYFHPDFKAMRRCNSCGRNVCDACMKRGSYCWACIPLTSGENSKIMVERLLEKEIELPIGRRKNLKTTKLSLFGYYLNENNRPTDVFHPDILALHCLIFPPVSSEKKPIPIIVHFENKNLGIIKSMWTENGKLIYTPIDIRKFTGIFGRIMLWVLAACLSYVLVIIYTLITKNISLLEFLKQWTHINYWIFYPLFFIIGLILTKYFVFPCRWSPRKIEVTGKIKDYVIDDWAISSTNRAGFRTFITLNTDIGEKYVLLECEGKTVQIEKEIKKEKISISNMEEYLESKKDENTNFKFIGRELYNVLVCNLQDRHCKMVELSSQNVEVQAVEPRTSQTSAD